MDDNKIIELYWERKEEAIKETALKYGRLCTHIAKNIRGVLFTIVCYEESMTEEQFIENGLDFTAYRYLFATSDKTYILHYASDMQYDPADKEQESIYQKMTSEIKDIQFVVDNIFKD